MVNRTEGVNSKEPAIRGRYTIDIQFFRVFRVFNKILKRLNKICIIEYNVYLCLINISIN